MTAANAATITGTTYSYDLAPGFTGGGDLYLDDIAGTSLNQTDTPFAAGDLNDGVIYTGTNPVTDGGGINSMVAWNPTPIASTITFDLGALYDINDVTVTTYALSGFNLGAATGVSISYSVDNLTYGPASAYIFTDGGNGAIAHTTGSTATNARYVQLAFDGTPTVGDKWGLTEISIDGVAAVPEPSSTALLGLGGLALLLRRRK